MAQNGTICAMSNIAMIGSNAKSSRSQSTGSFPCRRRTEVVRQTQMSSAVTDSGETRAHEVTALQTNHDDSKRKGGLCALGGRQVRLPASFSAAMSRTAGATLL